TQKPKGTFAKAASLDLFAVCLSSGMPVAKAAAIVARSAPRKMSEEFFRAAELLSLGADPTIAWANSSGDEEIDAVALLARRSAQSGTALAAGLHELAKQCRIRSEQKALAATERAGVFIAGPLGLCFLPAFLLLGIIPVVIGLTDQALKGGII
ncbi:MAG: type II secretion system F family protein, partial [Mycobacteriaceae bacterium]